MAFMGVLLGLFARVALQQGMFDEMGYTDLASIDAEMGLPLLLRSILPVGLMGLMMSAYFSAIMSTADSCLMAASGNVLTDIIGRYTNLSEHKLLRYSQYVTFGIGALSLLLATQMNNVLDLMLMSYSFMVSGLFVPLLAALFFKQKSSLAAWWSILVGGGTTLSLEILIVNNSLQIPLGLNPNLFGITASLITYFSIAKYKSNELSTYRG